MQSDISKRLGVTDEPRRENYGQTFS